MRSELAASKASVRAFFRLCLGAALALLGLGVVAVPVLAPTLTAPDRARTTSERGWAIPPGRERDVLALLAAFEGDFAGHDLGDVRIDRSEIRVALRPSGGEGARAEACSAPDWVEAPGGLRLTLEASGYERDHATLHRSVEPFTLTWWSCGDVAEREVAAADREARAALARMARHGRGEVVPGVWVAIDAPPPVDRPAHQMRSLITPLEDALGGLRAHWIVVVLWLLAIGMALGAPRLTPASVDAAAVDPAPAPSIGERQKALWLAAGILVLGGALRIVLASTLPLDSDEHWAFPSAQSIFGGDHDPSVHPPLFRALQEGYGHLIGWSQGDLLILLRMPSLLASIAALAVLAVATYHASTRPAPLLALVFVALSPTVAGAGVLARPYALAAVAVSVLGAALFARWRGAADDARLRLQVALAAFAVALWVDLVAGIAGGLMVAAYLATPGVPPRTRGVIGLAAVLLALPLVAGGLAALATQVHPVPAIQGVPPIDLGPGDGFGGGSPLFGALDLGAFASLGLERAGLLWPLVGLWWIACVIATPRDRRGALIALVATCLALFGIGMHVGLRVRNVLFLPHLAALAGAIALAAVSRRLRSRSGPEA